MIVPLLFGSSESTTIPRLQVHSCMRSSQAQAGPGDSEAQARPAGQAGPGPSSAGARTRMLRLPLPTMTITMNTLPPPMSLSLLWVVTAWTRTSPLSPQGRVPGQPPGPGRRDVAGRIYGYTTAKGVVIQ
jgi:hypothetical protein